MNVGSIRVTVDDATVEGRLAALGKAVVLAAAGATYKRAEKIMRESKDVFVPVDTGVLKASGHVDLPEVGLDEIDVKLGYGGAAKGYALEQHENEAYHHPPKLAWRYAESDTATPAEKAWAEHRLSEQWGQAKYLSKPLYANAEGFLEDVAAAVVAAVAKVG